MGMFDELRCSHRLPFCPRRPQDHLFQTKSMGCTMEEFRITEDGVLVHDITHTEDEDPPKDEDGKGGFPSFPSWRIVVDEKDVKEDFTGIINFYAWERDLSTKDNHAFLEYAALFEKGVMQAVVCVPEGVAAKEIEPYLRKTLKEKERGRWLMDMANLNYSDFPP